MAPRDDRALPGGFIAMIGVVALIVIVALWSRLNAPDTEAASTTIDFSPQTTTSLPGLTTTTVPTTYLAPNARGAVETAGWDRHDPGWLPARTGFVTLAADDRYVVWGGTEAPKRGRSFGQWFRFGGWSNMAPAPIEPGQNSVAVWTGREMFAFSGAAAAWDPDTNTWRSLAYPPTGSSALGGHPLATVWTGTEVILIGYEAHPPIYEDNLFVASYGPDLGCCRTYPDPPQSLSYGHAFWTGTEVLLIGALLNTEQTEALSEVRFARFDPTSEAWEPLESPQLDARSISATWTGSELFVVDRNLSAAIWSVGSGWTYLQGLPVANDGCTPSLASVGETVWTSVCDRLAVWGVQPDRWIAVATPEPSTGFPKAGCQIDADPASEHSLLMWCSDEGSTSFWSLDTEAYEIDE